MATRKEIESKKMKSMGREIAFDELPIELQVLSLAKQVKELTECIAELKSKVGALDRRTVGMVRIGAF